MKIDPKVAAKCDRGRSDSALTALMRPRVGVPSLRESLLFADRESLESLTTSDSRQLLRVPIDACSPEAPRFS
jgi:hypothetical protein